MSLTATVSRWLRRKPPVIVKTRWPSLTPEDGWCFMHQGHIESAWCWKVLLDHGPDHSGSEPLACEDCVKAHGLTQGMEVVL